MTVINNAKVLIFIAVFLGLTLVTGSLFMHRIKLQEELVNSELQLQEFNVLLKKFVVEGGPRFVNNPLFNTDSDKQLWFKELALLHGAQQPTISVLATNHYQLLFNVWQMSNLVNIADAIDNEPQAGITNLVVEPEIDDVGLSVKLEVKLYE